MYLLCYINSIALYQDFTVLVLILQLEYTKLEAENAHLQKELSDLREKKSETSNKIDFLEKKNIQLQKELEKALV